MSAVIVDHVSKDFVLRHNRAMGLKTRFLGLFHSNKREKREIFTALTDVHFTVEHGESLGLLGHNGSGKSTLLQIIAGILNPTRGRVITSGRVAPLIQLGVGFNAELTGYQNIFLNASLYGFRNKAIRSRVDPDQVDRFCDKYVRLDQGKVVDSGLTAKPTVQLSNAC